MEGSNEAKKEENKKPKLKITTWTPLNLNSDRMYINKFLEIYLGETKAKQITNVIQKNGIKKYDLLTGFAIDSSQLYFISSFEHVIKVIDLESENVSTLCGKQSTTGSEDGVGENARFFYPSGLAFHKSQRILFIADSNNTIRQIFLDERRVETLAGTPGWRGDKDSTLKESLFYFPKSLCFNSQTKELFVADRNNIRKISLEKGIVTTLDGIHCDPNVFSVFALDEKNNLLYVLDTSGIRQVKMSESKVTVSTLYERKGVEVIVDGNEDQARTGTIMGILFHSNLFITEVGSIRRISFHY